MPKKDGTGPHKGSTGPKDGSGGGKGKAGGSGTGKKTGGKKGECQNKRYVIPKQILLTG